MQNAKTGTFDFKMTGIAESPKKEVSKRNRRRLYIRNKKVPRWAEDMKIVAEESKKQT